MGKQHDGTMIITIVHKKIVAGPIKPNYL